MLSLPVRWNVMRSALWADGQPDSPEASGACPVTALARAYMLEYAAARWDGMARLMADDFEWLDRSAAQARPQPRPKRQVLAELRRYGEENGLTGLGLEFIDVFTCGNLVVFAGHVNAQGLLPGGAQSYRWRARQVCLISVRDGLIVRHEEICDHRHAEVSRWVRGGR